LIGVAPRGAPADQATAEEASYRRAMHRTRIEEASWNPKVAQDAASVFKAKLKGASELEEYLMGALRRMAADLLCKHQLSPRVRLLCRLSHHFFWFAGLRSSSNAEEKWVTS
jgi:hypothetical protein